MTTYILTRMPINSVPATRYELRSGRKSALDHLHPWGLADYVHNPTHQYGKLGLRATKMTFIRFYEHFRECIMYVKQLTGGMTEVDSYNVDFVKDEFSRISKIKKDLQLY